MKSEVTSIGLFENNLQLKSVKLVEEYYICKHTKTKTNCAYYPYL